MITPYYDKNGITIYNSDCLEIMPQLELVFDAIICDLPYGTTACAWDTIIPFGPLWENYKRLAKGNGAVVLFGSQPFTSKLVMSNLEWFKYEWIWDKVTTSNALNAKFMPLSQHETILVFAQDTTVFNRQFSDRPKSELRPNRTSNAMKSQPIPENVYREHKHGYSKENDYRQISPKSIVKFSRGNGWQKAKEDHPTQKPVALLAYLIRTYTNPGEIILDNTMGSGTTLVAAQNEGRQAVGIELNEEYCKIAVERLRQPSFFSIPDKPKTKPEKQLSFCD